MGRGIFKNRLTGVCRDTDTFVSHGRQRGSRMFPVFGVVLLLILPRTEKALVDDCGLKLQTRGSKGKIHFPVAVRGLKTPVLLCSLILCLFFNSY